MIKNIDFHAHILPSVDHGSDSIETTCEQLRYAQNAGIDLIVATPHFYPHKHNIDKFLNARLNAFNQVIKTVSSMNINIDIIAGAEILLCENLDKLKGIENLAIEGTKTLLIELPFSDFRNEYVFCIESLINKGFTIVLAHADRYDFKNIEALVSIGAKLQINASALSKIFIKPHIKSWLDRDLVVALGSDIHMSDKTAYIKYKKMQKKINKYFDKIMSNTEKLL